RRGMHPYASHEPRTNDESNNIVNLFRCPRCRPYRERRFFEGPRKLRGFESHPFRWPSRRGHVAKGSALFRQNWQLAASSSYDHLDVAHRMKSQLHAVCYSAVPSFHLFLLMTIFL